MGLANWLGRSPTVGFLYSVCVCVCVCVHVRIVPMWHQIYACVYSEQSFCWIDGWWLTFCVFHSDWKNYHCICHMYMWDEASVGVSEVVYEWEMHGMCRCRCTCVL